MTLIRQMIVAAALSVLCSIPAFADDIQTSFFPKTSNEVRIDAKTVSDNGREVAVQPRDAFNNTKFLGLIASLENREGERVPGTFRRNGGPRLEVVYIYRNNQLLVRVKGISYVLTERNGLDDHDDFEDEQDDFDL